MIQHIFKFVLFVHLSEVIIASEYAGIGELAASRHLLAKKEAATQSNGTTFYHNCTLLYTRGIDIMYLSGTTKTQIYTLPGEESQFSLAGSDCGSTGSSKKITHSVLNVNYASLKGNITSFSMKMTFNSSVNGEWFLQDMVVSLKCAQEKSCKSIKDETLNVRFIKSQIGFSYTCYQPQIITAMNGTMGIYFNKLQVQALDVKEKKFSAADDCVGFFSAGVWASLFITLILLVILSYGIGMISNINVMDRFDDPKGPGIQVNVNE